MELNYTKEIKYYEIKTSNNKFLVTSELLINNNCVIETKFRFYNLKNEFVEGLIKLDNTLKIIGIYFANLNESISIKELIICLFNYIKKQYPQITDYIFVDKNYYFSNYLKETEYFNINSYYFINNGKTISEELFNINYTNNDYLTIKDNFINTKNMLLFEDFKSICLHNQDIISCNLENIYLQSKTYFDFFKKINSEKIKNENLYYKIFKFLFNNDVHLLYRLLNYKFELKIEESIDFIITQSEPFNVIIISNYKIL